MRQELSRLGPNGVVVAEGAPMPKGRGIFGFNLCKDGVELRGTGCQVCVW